MKNKFDPQVPNNSLPSPVADRVQPYFIVCLYIE